MAEDSDWIEEQLRADRATPVRDDGFAQRVLADLPMPSRHRRSWIAPLMTAIGALLAVLSLGGPESAWVALRQIADAGIITLALIGLLSSLILLVSSFWGLSESK